MNILSKDLTGSIDTLVSIEQRLPLNWTSPIFFLMLDTTGLTKDKIKQIGLGIMKKKKIITLFSPAST